MEDVSMKVGLEAVASYFPDTVWRRSDHAYLDQVTPPPLERMLRGADEHRVGADDDALETLGEGAARRVIENAKLTPSDIDFIIAGSIGGKYVGPMVGTWVHTALGFPRNVPVLNIQNYCAGFIDGCNIAWNLVKSGGYKRVLVVMSTAFYTSKAGIDKTTPMARLFGDGAGAAIVSSQNLKCEFLSYSNETWGELYDHMTVELRKTENPGLGGLKVPELANYLTADQWFFDWQEREGKEFAIHVIQAAAKKVNLELSDLNMVIFHQAQDVLQEGWMEGGVELGLSKDKWKHTYHTYANIGNVDIAANLVEFWKAGEIKKNDLIAWFAPGLGGHTPAMVVRWLA